MDIEITGQSPEAVYDELNQAVYDTWLYSLRTYLTRNGVRVAELVPEPDVWARPHPAEILADPTGERGKIARLMAERKDDGRF